MEDKLILDAGCGPGNLSIGAVLLGAGFVTSVEIDADALEVFQENIQEMEIENIDIVQCDFLSESYFRYVFSFKKTKKINIVYLNELKSIAESQRDVQRH